MYRVPSSLQRGKKERNKLNLIPILDSVFIMIFFLLVSANFVTLKEISSHVPIISNEPPIDKDPLALTIQISDSNIKIMKGMNSELLKIFSINELDEIQDLMVKLKADYPLERTIIFEPRDSVNYESIVKLMDTVKATTDNKELFSNIVFSNIME